MILRPQEVKTLEKIQKITNNDCFDAIIQIGNKGYVDDYTLFDIINDLLYEYENLEGKKDEEIQSLKWKIEEMNDHGIY